MNRRQDIKVDFINFLELNEEYIEKIREWRNQDFVRKYMFNSEVITREEHFNFFKNLKKDNTRKLYLSLYDNMPMGVLQFNVDESEICMETGYYLIDSKFLNRGFGIIMSYAALKYAFETVKIQKVKGRVLAFNEGALNLNARMGYVTEDIVQQKIGQKFENVYIQYIYADVWQKNKKEIERLLKVLVSYENISEIK